MIRYKSYLNSYAEGYRHEVMPQNSDCSIKHIRKQKLDGN